MACRGVLDKPLEINFVLLGTSLLQRLYTEKYCVRSNARVGIERDPFASNRENPVVNGSNNNAEVLGVCERRTSS